jgi:hypothetical protein
LSLDSESSFFASSSASEYWADISKIGVRFYKDATEKSLALAQKYLDSSGSLVLLKFDLMVYRRPLTGEYSCSVERPLPTMCPVKHKVDYKYDINGNILNKSDVGDYSYNAASGVRPHTPNSITGIKTW